MTQAPLGLVVPDRTGLDNPALYSSESMDWLTPHEVLDRVQAVLGHINLDPCSNSKDHPNVRASTHYTREDDAFGQPWFGRIFMNPPYGPALRPFIEKLLTEYSMGNVAEAITLVPSRTDTGWFRLLRDFPICFIQGRLRFSGQENCAPFPSMAVYMGENVDGFATAFRPLGDIWVRC